MMASGAAPGADSPPCGEEPAGPARAVGLGAVLLLAGVHFAAFVDRAAPAVVAQPLKEAFGLTDGQVGALQGPAFALTFAAAMLAAGHWARRIEPLRLMAGCVALWTAGGVAFALADSYPMLVAARMALGIGQAAFGPAALVMLGSAGVVIGRARAVSIFTTGSATGRSGGLLMGGALLVVAGGASVLGLAPWRVVSLAVVLPNIVLVAALLALSRRGGFSPPDHAAGLGEGAGWLAGEGRAVLGLFAAGAGSIISVQAAGAWMPSILHRAFGLSPGEAAVTVGVLVLGAAPAGHLSAGWLLGRERMRGRSPAPAMAAGLILSMSAAVGLAAAASLAMAVAAMSVMVMGGGMAAAAALIGLQGLAPDRLRRAVNTLYLATVTIVGVGLGPWITGVLSDRTSQAGAGLTVSLAQVAVAVGIVVLPLVLVQGGRWAADRPRPVHRR